MACSILKMPVRVWFMPTLFTRTSGPGVVSAATTGKALGRGGVAGYDKCLRLQFRLATNGDVTRAIVVDLDSEIHAEAAQHARRTIAR